MTSFKVHVSPITRLPEMYSYVVGNGSPLFMSLIDRTKQISVPIDQIWLGNSIVGLFDDHSFCDFEVFFGGVGWSIDSRLAMPTPHEIGEIVFATEQPISGWLSGRINPERGVVFMEADPQPATPVRHVQIAKDLLATVSADDTIAGLWLKTTRSVTRAMAAVCREGQGSGFRDWSRHKLIELHGKNLPPARTGHWLVSHWCWAHVLLLAFNHGWEPAGTEAPDNRPAAVDSWSGSYFAGYGETVTKDDAEHIAKASEEGIARLPLHSDDFYPLPLPQDPFQIPGLQESHEQFATLDDIRYIFRQPEGEWPPTTSTIELWYRHSLLDANLLAFLKAGPITISSPSAALYRRSLG